MQKKVLIIEDDINIAKLIKEIVERKGNSAIIANDGEEACNVLNTTRFDLIVTDLKMPKVDGMSLIKMVRENDKDIPIIIITAYGSDSNIALAKSYGVSKILSKPCSIMEISEAIHTYISPI